MHLVAFNPWPKLQVALKGTQCSDLTLANFCPKFQSTYLVASEILMDEIWPYSFSTPSENFAKSF